MSAHFRPLGESVFVINLERGARKTAGGILLASDDGKESGIRNRWAQVAYLGPQASGIEIGEWILLPHGRWTNRIEIKTPDGPQSIWKVDHEAILLVSSDQPTDMDEALDILPPRS